MTNEELFKELDELETILTDAMKESNENNKKISVHYRGEYIALIRPKSDYNFYYEPDLIALHRDLWCIYRTGKSLEEIINT